jgi:hypothetical protein
MNERIKELAEKANIEFTYDPTETPVRAFAECWEDELEKFAELIISECAEIALVDGQSTGNFDTFNKIQKHFGVSV